MSNTKHNRVPEEKQTCRNLHSSTKGKKTTFSKDNWQRSGVFLKWSICGIGGGECERTFLYTAPMMAVRRRMPETKQTWKYFCSISDCRQVQRKSSAVKK